MRKFTCSFEMVFCLVVALFSITKVSAQVGSATDLYGTYEFTATMEVTEAGQQYKDLFSDKCEVTITSHSVYAFTISGIGGSKADSQGANFVNGSTINVMMPNGSSYYLWGAPVLFGGPNGESPFGGERFDVQYLVDSSTKNIMMTDFTAITVDETWSNSTVLARFSNCKLTFKEAEKIEVPDMGGEYKYTANPGIAESPVPVDFKLTLTATDDSYTLYDAAFDFGEGYVPFTLSATFNGDEMVIPFNDVYLNEAKTLALVDGYKPTSLEGSLRFKKLTETSLRLSNYLAVSKFDAEEETWVLEQYSTYGVAAQAAPDADNFAGTYHVVAGSMLPMFSGDDPYNVKYPTEFDFVIEKNEANGQFYVRQFVHGDIYNNTQGRKACTVEGNTLTIPVGDDVYDSMVYMSDDFSVMLYDVLYGPLGDTSQAVTLTLNEDGTCVMSDFFIARKAWGSAEPAELAVYYGELTVKKADGGSSVENVKEAAVFKAYVADGNIYIVGEAVPVQVFNASGACVFSGVSSKVTGLSKGLYIVKSGNVTVKVVL